MDPGGDRHGRKILPLGQGALDLELLRIIRDSGYRGPDRHPRPHQDDAEERLRDNLDGLDWLVPQLEGKPAGPRPKPRTPVAAPAARPKPRPPSRRQPVPRQPYDPALVAELVQRARAEGDPGRGAEVLRIAAVRLPLVPPGRRPGRRRSARTCRPPAACLKPEEIVESLLWPRRQVKEGFAAVHRRHRRRQGSSGLQAGRDSGRARAPRPGLGRDVPRSPERDIEEIRADGYADARGPGRRDVASRAPGPGPVPARPGPARQRRPPAMLRRHSHRAGRVRLTIARRSIPSTGRTGSMPVNRDRIYDFYAKEAEYFLQAAGRAVAACPPFPASTAARTGHWGNQNEDTWADGRWNQTDLGTVLCGVFRGAGVTVPKGVCVRLGERGELAACFNPETLCYEAVWSGGFVKFSATRHGFMDGLIMDGTPLPRPEGKQARRAVRLSRLLPARQAGHLRLPDRRRRVARRALGRGRQVHAGRRPGRRASARAISTRGGPAQWPQVLDDHGNARARGRGPTSIDTIEPPFENPWKALLFFGDHDFLPDGIGHALHDAGRRLARRRARRNARDRCAGGGLPPGCTRRLGLVVADGKVYVLGRDQITRLHDLNGDGEADFYECFSNAYATSPAGHDFICGLQRDAAGRFYTASGKQGLLADRGRWPVGRDVVATGFRNPDGLGLAPDGTITVPNSEGEWVPASMICEVRPGGHYGYRGPEERPAARPAAGLPAARARQLERRPGDCPRRPLRAARRASCSISPIGAGTHFLVLREKVDGQPQGAVVPLPGDFLSGVHRGRFNPRDGQLYVSGMAGWGTYTPADGCFQRVRYTGEPVQLPDRVPRPRERRPRSRFSRPLDRDDRRAAGPPLRPGLELSLQRELRLARALAAASRPCPATTRWRSARPTSWPTAARSSSRSPTFSPSISFTCTCGPDDGEPIDLFATVHKLAAPFTGFPGLSARAQDDRRPSDPGRHGRARVIKPDPNPWRGQIAGCPRRSRSRPART